ncbi:MAG: hypothetical protein R3D83_00250 [Caenibius sp.]
MTKFECSVPAMPFDDAAKAQDWLASSWMIPFNLMTAGWDSWRALNESWCKTVFCPAEFHAHEDHSQLEVPDPIRENGEHDLFA